MLPSCCGSTTQCTVCACIPTLCAHRLRPRMPCRCSGTYVLPLPPCSTGGQGPWRSGCGRYRERGRAAEGAGNARWSRHSAGADCAACGDCAGAEEACLEVYEWRRGLTRCHQRCMSRELAPLVLFHLSLCTHLLQSFACAPSTSHLLTCHILSPVSPFAFPQMSKAPIQAFADRVSAVFVPVIVALALLTWAAW